jgi:hypothetical protein
MLVVLASVHKDGGCGVHTEGAALPDDCSHGAIL